MRHGPARLVVDIIPVVSPSGAFHETVTGLGGGGGDTTTADDSRPVTAWTVTPGFRSASVGTGAGIRGVVSRRVISDVVDRQPESKSPLAARSAHQRAGIMGKVLLNGLHRVAGVLVHELASGIQNASDLLIVNEHVFEFLI